MDLQCHLDSVPREPLEWRLRLNHEASFVEGRGVGVPPWMACKQWTHEALFQRPFAYYRDTSATTPSHWIVFLQSLQWGWERLGYCSWRSWRKSWDQLQKHAQKSMSTTTTSCTTKPCHQTTIGSTIQHDDGGNGYLFNSIHCKQYLSLVSNLSFYPWIMQESCAWNAHQSLLYMR